MTDYVKLQNVNIAFKGEQILNNVNVSFPRGKTTMVVGSSGSGKSSILNCITGKVLPTEGSVSIDGHNLCSATNISSIRRNMGMLFQKSGLFQDLTISENVALPFYEHFPNMTDKQVKIAVKLKLQAVGLRGVAHKYPSQLSGGMERRVALARAVALDPALILYDEPLTGQDPISCGVLMSLMAALKEAYGATSIVVSHQIPTLKSQVDMICVVGNNTVLMNDTVENVFASKDPYIQQFLQGSPDGVVPFHHHAKAINNDLELGDIL